MNKLLIATIAVSLVMPKSNTSNAIHRSAPTTEQVKVTIEPSWEDLIDAIIFVESRGNDSAIGDRGKAVGCLQIQPICVREVNRILRKHKSNVRYSLQDRYSRAKSIQMFNIIAEQYICCEYVTFMEYAEIVSRRWNGGPRGDKKKATLKYWHKVKPHLQNKYEEQKITNT
jgi:hypothetical protein